MLLGFTHKNNNIAPSLMSFIRSQGQTITHQEITIQEYSYTNVLVKSGSSDFPYIINSPQAVQNCLDFQYVWQILDINGIRYNDSFDDYVSRTYKILVFENSVLSILSKGQGRGSTQSRYISEEQCKKIAELAKRVIYLLGLDYGMVKIGVTANKRTRVMSIEDSPSIREKDLLALFKKLSNLLANADKQKEVKMGADPEFMLANARTGKMIAASQFFPRDGTVGCDAIRIPNRQQRPIAELRPRPANSPLQLMSNLEAALRLAYKMAPYRNLKWLAGSRPYVGYSIGGHIHFSNLQLNNHILRALDNYLALPIFLIENQTTAAKRRVKYGFLADYRVKEYGGFEYRTLASWLVSPAIAAAVLCLGKIVTSNYLQLNRNFFALIESQRAFYAGDRASLRPLFKDLWDDIKKLDMYKAYKQELQIIPDMIKNNIIWDEQENILKTWSIGSSKGRKKKSIKGRDNSESVPNNPNRLRSTGSDHRIPRYNTRELRRGGHNNNPHTSSPAFMHSQSFYR